MSKKIITICSSAAFYRHVNEVAIRLEKRGYEVHVPLTATKMQKSDNYKVEDYKTWYENSDDFNKKAKLMRGHFDEVVVADAILVVNDEKNGIKGYIGPNVLMEMGLAFYLDKPIYVLNPVTSDMPLYEEVVGMGAVILNGKLGKVML